MARRETEFRLYFRGAKLVAGAGPQRRWTIETTIDNRVEDVRDEVIEWQRHLHQNPELSYEEVETSKYVYETLESFGDLELSRPTETSVLARLVGEESGRTIAIRADMDALPIEEETDLEFASRNPGVKMFIHATFRSLRSGEWGVGKTLLATPW